MAPSNLLNFAPYLTYSSLYPLTTSTLCSFTTFLAMAGLAPQTIKTYLSAVKFMNVYLGFPDFASPTSLKLVQRGVAQCFANASHPTCTRLPMTPAILANIKAVWQPRQYDQDTIMLWAALCTAFFGFLRLGEMTAPSQTSHDPAIHLCFNDLTVDCPEAPLVIYTGDQAIKNRSAKIRESGESQAHD